MNAGDRARHLVELGAETDRLLAAIDAETTALRARDIGALSGLAAAKTDAAAAWERRVAALRRSPGGLAGLPSEERRALRDLADRLAPAAEENARLLGIAVEAGRRTVAGIAEAAKSLAPGPGLYGRDGARAAPAHRGAPTGVAVSFDRSL